MHKTIAWAAIAAAACFALTVLPAHAADPAAGQKQYDATCIACHGPGGISVAPIYPNLAGQKEPYLVAQMKAFRDGTRQNAIMEPMAKGLSDTEIVNMSAYLAGLSGGQPRPAN